MLHTATQTGDAHTNKLVVGDKLKKSYMGNKDADDICNEILNDGKDVGVIGDNQGKD